jgi:hypothetical protein
MRLERMLMLVPKAASTRVLSRRRLDAGGSMIRCELLERVAGLLDRVAEELKSAKEAIASLRSNSYPLRAVRRNWRRRDVEEQVP